MAFDITKPANNDFLADFPPQMREQLRALKDDAISNAGKVNGLTVGNASGNIAHSNGTLCTNLNAERVGGYLSSAFSQTNHTHGVATTSTNGFLSNTDKLKLDSIANGAQVNQNAFSNILVGSTTIQADSATDTLELVAGTNISLSPDATNDRVIINNTYTHPATHAPSIITQDASNRFVTDAQISTWNNKANVLEFTPENAANKNVANGYAGLDASGKIASSVVPSGSVHFTFKGPSDNEASGSFIFETNKYLTQVRVICTDEGGTDKAPTAATTLVIYRNGNSVISFAFSTASTTYDVNPDVQINAGDVIYAKFVGATNGLEKVSVQLTVGGR